VVKESARCFAVTVATVYCRELEWEGRNLTPRHTCAADSCPYPVSQSHLVWAVPVKRIEWKIPPRSRFKTKTIVTLLYHLTLTVLLLAYLHRS
jgi:hypothetical protein